MCIFLYLLFNFYQYDVDRRIFWFILVHVIYLENSTDIFLSQRYKFTNNTDCSTKKLNRSWRPETVPLLMLSYFILYFWLYSISSKAELFLVKCWTVLGNKDPNSLKLFYSCSGICHDEVSLNVFPWTMRPFDEVSLGQSVPDRIQAVDFQSDTRKSLGFSVSPAGHPGKPKLRSPNPTHGSHQVCSDITSAPPPPVRMDRTGTSSRDSSSQEKLSGTPR